jgi:exodeoxyribonuclease VII large subunit
MTNRIAAGTNDIGHLSARVRALSPAATLDRGYAIVMAESGLIVRSPGDVATGDLLDIRVAEGRLSARTTGTTGAAGATGAAGTTGTTHLADEDGPDGQED